MFDKSYETKKREEEKIFKEYLKSLKSRLYN